ncbi:hypothetical protein [Weissella confusa]|uniref:hypothetical protein n=1 Tax=Weissella confusa TaxID=1583 RepID=UPI0018F1625B|nr:hypothetical protein [Weissella confusa]MBJ7652099.1 hypothetical protein [Weissella confusa]
MANTKTFKIIAGIFAALALILLLGGILMDWPSRINNLVVWGSLSLSYLMMYIDGKDGKKKWQLAFFGFFAIAFLVSVFTNFMALK